MERLRPSAPPSRNPNYHREYRELNRTALRDHAREYRRVSPARLWSGAKARAKQTGQTFTISVDDIIIPERCPVLNIPLVVGNGRHHPGSPSIDRWDNTKGYTPDNIRIVSRRANTLKSDATVEELRAIIRYMEHGETQA